MVDTNSGPILEGTIKSTFGGKGFEIVKYSDWSKNKENYGDELLLTHVPYDTIYDHQGATEFLVISKKNDLKIRIECKWQQSGGSVDEKLPYLYLNAIEKMPEENIIIVIDGEGWKRGAIPWLKNAVKERKYIVDPKKLKDIKIMNLMEFLTWANKLFR